MPTSTDPVPRTNALRMLVFLLLSVVLGLVAGLGAGAFRALIAGVHNLFFLGELSFVYDVNAHTPPGPWGPFVILVPVLGAVGVVYIVKNFAPEAKGHGVPEVMDAVYYNRGIIRPIVALMKSLASALCIGTGGAIGREGPIIQIGSAVGSTLGQLLRMSAWQRNTLIAAGAGAGIGATFNTPVGGILFATEILMHEVSVRTLVPVAVCTAMGTYVGRLLFGSHPSFMMATFETHYFRLTNPVVLLTYVGLGLILGVASMIFIRSIYGAEDFFEKRLKGNDYTRHMLGMFSVGVIMYVLLVTQGHYYVAGVGYSTVQDILSGMPLPILLLLLLFALKLVATSLTLGSGGSGGIFSPALFLGATLGAAYGTILARLFPTLSITPPAFAVAGMAGLVAGATGAALTAIVMIFEMTLDYDVIIPMTITVALSYGMRRALFRDSIYTLKLGRRGHHVPETLHVNFHYLKRAEQVMDTRFGVVSAASSPAEFARLALEQPEALWFVVEHRGDVVGVLQRGEALAAMRELAAILTIDLVDERSYAIVTEKMPLLDVVARMRASRAPLALVIDEGQPTSADNVRGIVTKECVADAMGEAIDLLSQQ